MAEQFECITNEELEEEARLSEMMEANKGGKEMNCPNCGGKLEEIRRSEEGFCYDEPFGNGFYRESSYAGSQCQSCRIVEWSHSQQWEVAKRLWDNPCSDKEYSHLDYQCMNRELSPEEKAAAKETAATCLESVVSRQNRERAAVQEICNLINAKQSQ